MLKLQLVIIMNILSEWQKAMWLTGQKMNYSIGEGKKALMWLQALSRYIFLLCRSY
jgi:hypothetical protein